ncbi:hypothetical protein J1N35_021272 [Gossypium stocksii]|uniref:Reverse transcriptase domain-containing protein n=1 Tax=Gossypium stocksii TaxID=47602 RepID=A0A9D3VEX1_9ROSI|nr:hypothetical protein J1N35_021272 [Gossypium stocksii]
MVNFRPIILCSVVYKMIANAIANRFQKVLELCINKAQSVFVSGRLISDIVLLAYEILHMFCQKRKGRKCFMTLKLDMSKAYDRVEWGSIRAKMKRMGFDVRGLRQGDLFSPFLFLICNKGFSTLMRMALQEGLIKRAKISRGGPQISHLHFVDDYVLFGEANERGIQVLKDLIDKTSREWKREVIFNIFSARDVGRILQIPLEKERHDDLVVWQGEPSGEFLVRKDVLGVREKWSLWTMSLESALHQ